MIGVLDPTPGVAIVLNEGTSLTERRQWLPAGSGWRATNVPGVVFVDEPWCNASGKLINESCARRTPT
jgi:hypothetical protein